MMFAEVTVHQLRYVLLEAGHTSVYAATLAEQPPLWLHGLVF